MTGKLNKVFNEFNDQNSIELSVFCFGARQRKFYLSDNSGNVRQYNMKNGEFLKNVNDEKEIEDSEFSKKQIQVSNKKDVNEISQMIYIHEEKLLICSYSDSTIRIYDESESEESILIKVLTGGHMNAEIVSLVYSSKQSFIASGSINGIIALWEFETGKLESILKADDIEITCLEFLDPYPAIAAASLNGAVYIWGTKNCNFKYKYQIIIKIMNSMWIDGIEQYFSVNSIICESELNYGLKRCVPVDDFIPEDVENFKPIIQKSSLNFKQFQKQKKNNNWPITQQEETNSEKKIIISEESTQSETDNLEKNETFQKYWFQYDQNKQNNKQQNQYCYIYLGDTKGFIQIWNLSDIFYTRNIIPIKEEKKKQSFQLRRKDLINASKTAENLINSQENKNNKYQLTVHALNSVLLHRWVGHQGLINKICKIEEPKSIISCSFDKHVNIWSLEGELYSKINLGVYDKQTKWYFPFDWIEQKIQDLDQVFSFLKIIENNGLSDEEIEKARKIYLIQKYFTENDINDLKNKLIKKISILEIMKKMIKTQKVFKIFHLEISQINYQQNSNKTKKMKKTQKNKDYYKINKINNKNQIKLKNSIIQNKKKNFYNKIIQNKNQKKFLILKIIFFIIIIKKLKKLVQYMIKNN
ncbi:hypothetical protein IMG5_000130 [Ichthyophthirius multifiliis]|uniref:Uncharacterized protein n=1 Tax=Ichthyophthirius multifiliis TaxID=5932 RepID=G0QIP1_ICHMU|nr:hypothetical protein IMG5_000130 [Ichthyophthirius multifiliis]EGR34916.1 hypothetical protein IMG5_000130 [Ichthyophthirius multifiliis]|eukprot:XP_004040220.1 hypothetical protein IMG5_000130 [Ichthyophthirius multifiliis]